MRRQPAFGLFSSIRSCLASRSGIDINTPADQIIAFPAPLFAPNGDTMLHVDIIALPGQRLATLRHTGPYNRISETFARLGAIAGPAGLFGPEAAMLAVYYDDPQTTPAEELRSDAALGIAPGRDVPAALVERTLPAGRYARTTHMGSYASLGDSWVRFLGHWLPRSGHHLGSGPRFERYLNTPMDVPVEALRTELFIHLA
jgi:AraC family transcriptional regulator